jgi:hypothetical protein
LQNINSKREEMKEHEKERKLKKWKGKRDWAGQEKKER